MFFCNNINNHFTWIIIIFSEHILYRWVTFRDLRGLSKEFTAEALREAAITIWVDDKTDFGTNLIEAVKCGGIVIAKVPNQIQDWMIEDGELTKSILWFNELDEVPRLLPSVVHSWITDSVPEEVYKNQDSITPLFTEEIQTLEIIECYEKNIINKRLKDFEEAKADIENKVENK